MLRNLCKKEKLILLSKITIYISASLLAIAGMVCRASLGRFELKDELIAVFVPLIVTFLTVLCWHKLPIAKSVQTHPFLWTLAITVFGVIMAFFANQIRIVGRTALPWGALSFCMAGAMTLSALKKRGLFGFLGFFLYQVGTGIICWRCHETAGVVIIAAITVILVVLSAKQRWFFSNSFYCFFAIYQIVLGGIYLITTDRVYFALLRLYDAKLGPLHSIFPNIENASARMVIPFAKFWGQAEVSGKYADVITEYLSCPVDDYMLSSNLFRYGWICTISIAVLMLTIPLIGLYLTSSTSRKGLNYYLSKAANSCLFVSIALYLSQAFGFCVVRAMYVPFFDRQPVSGTLSLLLLVLTVEGLSHPPNKEANQEIDKSTSAKVRDESNDKEIGSSSVMSIDQYSMPYDLDRITGDLFSNLTFFIPDCSWMEDDVTDDISDNLDKEDYLKAELLHAKSCFSIVFYGESCSIEKKIRDMRIYQKSNVLVDLMCNPLSDAFRLVEVLFDGLGDKPGLVHIFYHADDDIDPEFCILKAYFLEMLQSDDEIEFKRENAEPVKAENNSTAAYTQS